MSRAASMFDGAWRPIAECPTKDLQVRFHDYAPTSTRGVLLRRELELRGWVTPRTKTPRWARAASYQAPAWQVAEGIAGTFHYHLRDHNQPRPLAVRAACGAEVMQTSIPLSAWGHVGHLRERWCPVCAARAELPKGNP